MLDGARDTHLCTPWQMEGSTEGHITQPTAQRTQAHTHTHEHVPQCRALVPQPCQSGQSACRWSKSRRPQRHERHPLMMMMMMRSPRVRVGVRCTAHNAQRTAWLRTCTTQLVSQLLQHGEVVAALHATATRDDNTCRAKLRAESGSGDTRVRSGGAGCATAPHPQQLGGYSPVRDNLFLRHKRG